MNKGTIKIGSTEYTPKSLNCIYDSLASENSGRSDDGKMHIKWVRRYITKLEIVMPPMKAADVGALLAAVQGQTVSVQYYDLRTSAFRTVDMYCSTSNSDFYSGILYNGLVNGVSFNLIEI